MIVKVLSVAYIHSANGQNLAEWYAKTLGITVKTQFPGWTQ